MEQVIIIGSGPAGYTAAIYSARAGLSPLLFAGEQVGGQLTTTTEVENFPGFKNGIMGPKLMDEMRAQSERFGAKVMDEAVTDVNFSSEPLKVMVGDKQYETKTVIVATGASAKRLGLENEKILYGKGVSACATCDAFFFKGKKVMVVGGGDTAMEDASYLTKFASEVISVHRSEQYKASEIMLKKARANSKIKWITNTEVVDVLGAEVGHVTGVKLKNNKTGELSEMSIDGLFAAIGHEPNTKIFAGKLTLDEKGYIKPKGNVLTEVPGVFVAGDVADFRYRQAITAAGTGCMAALEAEKFIEQ